MRPVGGVGFKAKNRFLVGGFSILFITFYQEDFR